MRLGNNPHKDKTVSLGFSHQVVIPLYIPNTEGYYINSYEVFKVSLDSLRKTCHDRTFISVIDNGCSEVVRKELKLLLEKGAIHELAHCPDIGKLNAILKGLAGMNTPLVTIADADVFFLPGWQQETVKIFTTFPKAGVVGIVPQIKMWEYCAWNVLFDNLFNGKLSFVKIPDPEAMLQFYDSIGWKRDTNPDYFNYSIGIQSNSLTALVGSGHFVATYRRALFSSLPSHFNFNLGGNSEAFLDHVTLEKDYWRLTTLHNFAYHMGNQILPWMEEKVAAIAQYEDNVVEVVATNRIKIGLLPYTIKNRLFPLFYKKFYRLFLKRWKLPADAVSNFHQFVR